MPPTTARSRAIATAKPLAPEQLQVSTEGEVLVAGVASPVAGGGSTETFLARLRPDGNLDPTFRGGGISFFDIGLGESTPEPSALEIGSDGEIYLAGPISRSSQGHVWVPAGVRAFLPDGQRDRRFGSTGFAKLRGNEHRRWSSHKGSSWWPPTAEGERDSAG